MEKKSGRGKQSHPDYMRLGSMSGGARVASHIRTDLMDFCRLVECANRCVYVVLGGVKMVGVYSKCRARVHGMMQWLEGIQASIGSGHWVLIGDWIAHHVRWSLDGRGDPVGRVIYEWQVARGARLVRGREHTFERRRRNGVVVSRIDFAIAGGCREPESLVTGWGLSDHSAIGCMVAVEGFEEAVGNSNNNTSGTSAWSIKTTKASPTSMKTELYSA